MTEDDAMVFWVFVALSILLFGAELFAPGFVLGFFGLASVITAGLIYSGSISGLLPSLIAFLGIGTALLLSLRGILKKLMPAEAEHADIDEGRFYHGKTARVIEPILEFEPSGRIAFEGTTWQAMSNHAEIEVGAIVRLLFQKDGVWIVEPMDEVPSDFGLQPVPSKAREQIQPHTSTSQNHKEN